MTKLCFIDTETTGLDPDRHEVWEVGLIVRDDTHLASGVVPADVEYVWQLPVDLSRADPMALDIGHFHERRDPALSLPGSRGMRHVVQTNLRGEVDLPLLAEVERERFSDPELWARRFVDLTYGGHLIGAVVSFDAERLWKLLRSLGQCPMWHHHLVDVEALAAGWLAGAADGDAGAAPAALAMAAPPWDSSELSKAIGVDRDKFEQHTALGDARWARSLYDAVMS